MYIMKNERTGSYLGIVVIDSETMIVDTLESEYDGLFCYLGEDDYKEHKELIDDVYNNRVPKGSYIGSYICGIDNFDFCEYTLTFI